MTHRLVVAGCLIFATMMVVSGFGQTGTTTSSSGPGGDPQTSSGFGKNANWDQLTGHQHGSMSFTGKVAIAGGQMLWDPIPVTVLCDGKPRYNTQTDLKGNFRIVATPRSSEVAPEAGRKPVTAADLIGCGVKAMVEGYKSSTVTIANRDMMDDSDIGTITLGVDEHAKGTAISATTKAAPKEAIKDFEKARAEANDKHPDSAQKDLEKAVKVYPQFAEAWYQLGKLEEATKPQDAYDAYSKAAAADPDFAPTYEHLALVAAQQKNWQAVVDATDHALQLNPAGTAQIWYFSALGNLNVGKKDVAEKAAMTSLAMDPSHVAPNTEQLLAVMLAGRGDYAGALAHLQSCLTYTPPGPNADLMKQQIEQLQKFIASAKK
jgi:cytochrome c-type biogenesis protein CcmH/NrfG